MHAFSIHAVTQVHNKKRDPTMQIRLPDKRVVEVRCHEDDIPIIASQLEYSGYEEWSDNKVKQYLNTICSALRLTKTADDVLTYNGEDDEYNWVVPDMFEEGDRLIITGVEGTGKSTLIMQWLVQVSAGIHPLTGKAMDPKRVLLIDLEYGMSELSRRLQKLERLAGKKWDCDNFRVISKPEGWDLLLPENQQALTDLTDVWYPEIIAISPLYKAFVGDETDDVVASKLTSFLNVVSRQWGSVVIAEAHTAKPGPSGRRPETPIGSSVWTRWPEFGIFLAPDGKLRHFRGPRDAEREWPAVLKRGGKWPWTATTPTQSEDIRWKQIRALAVKLGRKPSSREVEKAIAIPQSTAQRVMKEHAGDWPAFG